MAPAGRTRPVTDPKAWLALAHPLRMDILQQLQMRASARATDLARALGVAPNSVSFHLRQLARFGYVEPDDTPRSDGRERWWRSTSPDGFRIEQSEQDPEAAGQVAEVMRRRTHDQVDDWFDAIQLPDETWTEPLRTSNYDLHLSLTREARETFLDELRTVFEKWMDLSRTPEPDEDREEYVMFGYGLPRSAYDEVRARRASGSSA
jgi:DNA-binding transcriptional ArsR family regulator